MLLITLNEWLGPGRTVNQRDAEKIPSVERQIAMASMLPLSETIDRIHRYQIAFNAQSIMAINYRLLCVSEIDDISEAQLEKMDVAIVEKLKQNPGELE